jgi:PAS domain S-box-containing protein
MTFSDNSSPIAQSTAEALVRAQRDQGGVFVEAVRFTRMPMIVTDCSLSRNGIVYANDAFLRLSGYEEEEVLGRDPHFMALPGREPDVTRSFAEPPRRNEPF